MTREEFASACLSHALTKAFESEDPHDIHTWLINAKEAAHVSLLLSQIRREEAYDADKQR